MIRPTVVTWRVSTSVAVSGSQVRTVASIGSWSRSETGRWVPDSPSPSRRWPPEAMPPWVSS